MPLVAHFLNVGRGDCTIIELPSGRVAMIDIDNLSILDDTTRAEELEQYHKSLEFILASAATPGQRLDEVFLAKAQERITDPLAYYDANIGASRDIFRLLITHPDMDHMTGLYRLHHQDARKRIINFWHTGPHDFNLADCTEEEWRQGPYDQRDWETYKELRAGTSPKSLQLYKDATGQFWTEDGIQLWAPTEELEALAEERQAPNILSTVLKISHAGRSIVLGGDATGEETWPAIYPFIDMTGITVLKASHHGRKTGYHQPSVKEMSPWLTITSVGTAEHDATKSYRQYSAYTVSLRRAGNIKITIQDDGSVQYAPHDLSQHWKPRR